VTFLSGLKQRLADGLRRSQEFLAAELKTVFEPERPIDDALFEELEEILIAADIGAALAADFKHRAKEEQMFGTLTRAGQLRPLFRRFLVDTLEAKSALPAAALRRKTIRGAAR
jgi:fused signal recognition particle receptor